MEMKWLVILELLVLFVDHSFLSPLTSQAEVDLTSQKELGDIIKLDHIKYRWVMIPDAAGRMYLTDLDKYDASVIPLFVAEKDMRFYLYTRKAWREEIKMDVRSIRASSFNRNHPTRLTIHGWNGDETSAVNSRVIEEYLKLGDFNCIMVDWSQGSGTLDYIAARYRITGAAKLTAAFLDFMHQNRLLRFQTLHIVGHSLGAHLGGLVGKFVKNGQVNSIFGLDPAGPLFYQDEPEGRIADTDGAYVEIMHTAGGSLGFGEPLGHADFFPNFGRSQPGCWLDITGTCAHKRAPEYFAESINTVGFTAIPCASFTEITKKKCTDQSPNETIIMRPELNGNFKGYFLVTTNSYSPFAMY